MPICCLFGMTPQFQDQRRLDWQPRRKRNDRSARVALPAVPAARDAPEVSANPAAAASLKRDDEVIVLPNLLETEAVAAPAALEDSIVGDSDDEIGQDAPVVLAAPAARVARAAPVD
ncbi:hypothetical protein CAEBREN_17767 [Caenorhabditis brenneri]|uniref:Uncharacterized protein n=1 Tax=Caenorhabditis brenneri TaxID=135651 RepID=G0NNR8_CAEBE|nr:hypothetical protein CAEBREN_17767 [Caenorhabditis brenneri]